MEHNAETQGNTTENAAEAPITETKNGMKSTNAAENNAETQVKASVNAAANSVENAAGNAMENAAWFMVSLHYIHTSK